jgi:hypothetical protein
MILALLPGLLGGIIIYGFMYFMIFFVLFMKYAFNPIMDIINKFTGQYQNAMGT